MADGELLFGLSVFQFTHTALVPLNAHMCFIFFPAFGKARRVDHHHPNQVSFKMCIILKEIVLSEQSTSILYLKSLKFNAKTDISISIRLRYLRLKLLKNIENNKNICDIFHHIFKHIPCYVASEVLLKRFYFALFDDGLTLKTLKLAYIGFAIKLFNCIFYIMLYKISLAF